MFDFISLIVFFSLIFMMQPIESRRVIVDDTYKIISWITRLKFISWAKNIWKENYEKYKTDTDYKIIYTVLIMLFIVSVLVWLYPAFVEDGHYDKTTIALQIQLITVCLAIIAASIAFRNYQRKSGQDLYYLTLKNTKLDFPHINALILYNNKDRAVAIFAIDIIILKTKQCIRIFQDNSAPILVSAYSSEVIRFEPISKYTKKLALKNFFANKIQVICLTHNENIEAKYTNNERLGNQYKQKCIFPKTVTNIPKGYNSKIVPSDDTYWLHIIESELVLYEDGRSFIGEKSSHLTGHFKDDILQINIDSINNENIVELLKGKSYEEIQTLIQQTEDMKENLIFDQYDGVIGLISMEKIKFKTIKRVISY